MLKRIIIISLVIFACNVKNAESWNTANITVMTASATVSGTIVTTPVITHTPLNEINILGNKLFIKAGVDNYDAITNMILYYHNPEDTNYQAVNFNLSPSPKYSTNSFNNPSSINTNVFPIITNYF